MLNRVGLASFEFGFCGEDVEEKAFLGLGFFEEAEFFLTARRFHKLECIRINFKFLKSIYCALSTTMRCPKYSNTSLAISD